MYTGAATAAELAIVFIVAADASDGTILSLPPSLMPTQARRQFSARPPPFPGLRHPAVQHLYMERDLWCERGHHALHAGAVGNQLGGDPDGDAYRCDGSEDPRSYER